MNEFDVGARVVVVDNTSELFGMCGTIVALEPDLIQSDAIAYLVKLDDGRDALPFRPDDIASLETDQRPGGFYDTYDDEPVPPLYDIVLVDLCHEEEHKTLVVVGVNEGTGISILNGMASLIEMLGYNATSDTTSVVNARSTLPGAGILMQVRRLPSGGAK